jgi:hypothetical protein
VRAFRFFEPEVQELFPYLQDFASPLIPLVGSYAATHTTTISPIEFLVCGWVSVMGRCLDLQRNGVRMFCARYEDLKVAPRSVLAALFAYCGLSMSNPAHLDRVLAQDSQRGTNLSQESAQQSTSILTQDHLDELYRLLTHYAPTIPADFVVPGTFLPSRA